MQDLPAAASRLLGLQACTSTGSKVDIWMGEDNMIIIIGTVTDMALNSCPLTQNIRSLCSGFTLLT